MAKIIKKKGVVGIDWLQFQIKSNKLIHLFNSHEIVLDQGNVVLILQPGETRLYLNRYTAYYQGYEVADILINPKLPQINKPDLINCRIHNHLLYSKQLWPVVDNLIWAFDGKFNNITRLDIFCDTTGVLGYCDQFNMGLLALKNKFKTQPIKDSKNKVQTQYLGSRKSDKHVTIYNKTLELQESNKIYIKKSIKESRIAEPEQDIHRIEVSLKSQIFLQFPNFKFSDLRNHLYVIKLFLAQVHSQIQFYKPKKGKRTNQCNTINILPNWLVAIRKLESTKKLTPKITWRKKLHIKSCVEESSKTPEKQQQLQFALSLAIDYGLEDWFWQRLDVWREFYTKLYHPVDPVDNLSVTT